MRTEVGCFLNTLSAKSLDMSGAVNYFMVVGAIVLFRAFKGRKVW
jgi:hypothetical protein